MDQAKKVTKLSKISAACDKKSRKRSEIFNVKWL